MDIGKVIVSKLTGYAVYPVVAPQGTTGNYIVYQTISYLPTEEKALSTLDVALVQLTFIADTYSAGVTMALTARGILDGVRGVFEGIYVDSIRFDEHNDLFDLESRTYIISNTYALRVKTGYIDVLEDLDGNLYNTIKIGSLVWTVENWRCTKYSDGTSIPLVAGAADWESLDSGAYCENGDVSVYGRLYNGYAAENGLVKVTNQNEVDSRWRIPTKADWEDLVVYIGGIHFPTVSWADVGGKLKATGTDYWKSPNTGATDEYGFKALPNGRRGVYGNYTGLTTYFYLMDNVNNIYDVYHDSVNINRNAYDKRTGTGLRIVRNYIS